MTARTCEECKYDGGWHLDDPDNPRRCPNYLAEERRLHEAELALKEATDRDEAAWLIVQEAAKRFPEFSTNQIREEIDAAQIDDQSTMGRAFTRAQREALIVATGRREPSVKKGTKSTVNVWRSLDERWGRSRRAG